MATINELIFNIKQMMSSKNYQEEYNFTDSYILFLLNIERANIFNKTQEVSNTYYQRLKLSLIKRDNYYISENSIPNIIGHTTPTKEVYSIRGIYINDKLIASYITSKEWNFREYRKFSKKQNVFTIIENKLYLSIDDYLITNLKELELEAIFNNPIEVIQSNDSNYIFMQDDIEYPMPDKYASIIANNIFNLYVRTSYQMGLDQTTNRNET